MAARKSPKPKRRVTAFHRRLRELREEKGWSLVELGGRLEVDASTVNHWELGIAYPPLHRMAAIAEAFDVDASDLIDLYVESRAAA